jgi:hypothetical protein
MLSAMNEAHVEVGGKDPKATLDSRLRYSGLFTNIRGMGWWLNDRPVPGSNGSATGTQEEVSAAQEDRP